MRRDTMSILDKLKEFIKENTDSTNCNCNKCINNRKLGKRWIIIINRFIKKDEK